MEVGVLPSSLREEISSALDDPSGYDFHLSPKLANTHFLSPLLLPDQLDRQDFPDTKSPWGHHGETRES